MILAGRERVVDESLYPVKQLERVGWYCRLHPDSPYCYIDTSAAVCERVGGGDVVLLKHWNDDNYGHWLFENFSRISLIRELFDLTKLRFVITKASEPIRSVYLAAFRALGIDADQLIEADHRPIVIERLIYPSPLTQHPWVIAPRVIEFLEEVGKRVDPTPRGPKRVYVSRNKFGRRSLRNEAELIAHLERSGFAVLNCEELAFDEQVKAFRNAELVVGNQGAALSNTVFCPRGFRLLALTNEFMGDSWFWDLVDHKEGEYISIHGKAEKPELGMQSAFSPPRCSAWAVTIAPACRPMFFGSAERRFSVPA